MNDLRAAKEDAQVERHEPQDSQGAISFQEEVDGEPPRRNKSGHYDPNLSELPFRPQSHETKPTDNPVKEFHTLLGRPESLLFVPIGI